MEQLHSCKPVPNAMKLVTLPEACLPCTFFHAPICDLNRCTERLSCRLEVQYVAVLLCSKMQGTAGAGISGKGSKSHHKPSVGLMMDGISGSASSSHPCPGAEPLMDDKLQVRVLFTWHVFTELLLHCVQELCCTCGGVMVLSHQAF